MELPEIKTTKTYKCRHCTHAKKAVDVRVRYCALFSELVGADDSTCQKFHYDEAWQEQEFNPEKFRAKKTETQTGKKTVDPKAPKTVRKPLYVYVGTDPAFLGKIIGREGRNIRQLQDLAETKIEIKEGFARIDGETSLVNQRLCAGILYGLWKGAGMPVNPRNLWVIWCKLRPVFMLRMTEQVLSALLQDKGFTLFGKLSVPTENKEDGEEGKEEE